MASVLLRRTACLLLLASPLMLVLGQQSTTSLEMLKASIDTTNLLTNWNQGDPCANGWTGVTCNNGVVQQLSLSHQNLVGSIPDDTSVWSGLNTLTVLDLSFNNLNGTIPASMDQLGSSITLINLANNDLYGSIPSAWQPATAQGTPTVMPNLRNLTIYNNAGLCGAYPSGWLSSTGTYVSADSTFALPCLANGTGPSLRAVPQGCSACALESFNSNDCQTFFSAFCAQPGANATICSAFGNRYNVASAAVLAQYLLNQCFPQDTAAQSICKCYQDPTTESNYNCAHARLDICVAQNAECVATAQTFAGDYSGAQGYLTAVAQCQPAAPQSNGVTATFDISGLTLDQMETYNPKIESVLSSITNVSSGSISLVSVKPIGSGLTAGRRLMYAIGRHLLQTFNGVEATYYLASDNPTAVQTALNNANSNLLGLFNNGGVPYAPTLTAQTVNTGFTPSSTSSGGNGRALPLWAIIVIAVGGFLLIAAIIAAVLCAARRRSHRRGSYGPDSTGIVKTEAYDVGAPGNGYAYPAAGGAANRGPAPVLYTTAPLASAVAASKLTPTGSDPNNPFLNQDVTKSDQNAYYTANTNADVPRPPVVPAVYSANGVAPATAVPALAGAAAAAAPAAAVANTTRSPATAAPPTAAAAAPVVQQNPAAASSDGLTPPGWQTNIRPIATTMPAVSSPMGRTEQQQQRARFWAQFQETWQQVRNTKNTNRVDGEPDTPSSGTSWSSTMAPSTVAANTVESGPQTFASTRRA